MRMICEVKVVCSLSHLGYLLTMWIHLFSAGKLLFTGSCMVSIPTQEMVCEIKVVYSLFHLRYLLTMCIHLFADCKLIHAWLAFQHKGMICHIELICSLFHLRYLNMCIDLFSGGKLLFSCLCMVSIPTQENDL